MHVFANVSPSKPPLFAICMVCWKCLWCNVNWLFDCSSKPAAIRCYLYVVRFTCLLWLYLQTSHHWLIYVWLFLILVSSMRCACLFLIDCLLAGLIVWAIGWSTKVNRQSQPQISTENLNNWSQHIISATALNKWPRQLSKESQTIIMSTDKPNR